MLAACSGGTDGESTASSTTDAPTATVATLAPATTAAPAPTTSAPLVVTGATVIVANGNIIGGSAGRMTDALALEGFETGPPVDGTDKVEASIVYHVDDPAAAAVAAALATKLGGVTVELLPETAPIDGEFTGDVLLLLGNLQADKSIAELSGSSTVDADAAGETAGETVENGGSTIVVANASGVGGSAGRMSELLAAAGFTMGTPTNSTAQASESVVYYASEAAKPDADVLAVTLGGLTVLALPDDVPTESGSLDGDILVVLGSNEAGASLADLAG